MHLGEEAIERAADNAKEERAALRHESVAVGREGTRPLHPSTPQKRNVSDASIGGRSPNTTPKKLKKPETYIQNLQNTLVNDLLRANYGHGIIRVDWPRGRDLHLFYQPYSHIIL